MSGTDANNISDRYSIILFDNFIPIVICYTVPNSPNRNLYIYLYKLGAISNAMLEDNTTQYCQPWGHDFRDTLEIQMSIIQSDHIRISILGILPPRKTRSLLARSFDVGYVYRNTITYGRLLAIWR